MSSPIILSVEPAGTIIRPLEIMVSYLGLAGGGDVLSLQRFSALTSTMATITTWLAVPLLGRIAFCLLSCREILFHVLVGYPGFRVEPGSGLILLGFGFYAGIALIGLLLYFFVWASRSAEESLLGPWW